MSGCNGFPRGVHDLDPDDVDREHKVNAMMVEFLARLENTNARVNEESTIMYGWDRQEGITVVIYIYCMFSRISNWHTCRFFWFTLDYATGYLCHGDSGDCHHVSVNQALGTGYAQATTTTKSRKWICSNTCDSARA